MKKKTALILTAVFIIGIIGFAGCNTIKAAELSRGYARTAQASGAVTDEFIAAASDFSFKLLNGLTQKENNDAVSPVSALYCLALMANGAAGNTKAQIEGALGMSVENLNTCLFAYGNSLYSDKNCKVSLANSIWFRDDGAMHVKESFLQANADWYAAEVYATAFDGRTVKDINNWCSKHTDRKIKKIIDNIDNDTVMYLINALLFDAKWLVKYEKSAVSDKDFFSYDGSVNSIKMLNSAEETFISGEGVRGFAKPYHGNKYSFVALLPDKGTDIYDYAASLNGEEYQSLWKGRKNKAVNATMPEFTFDTKYRLNDTLQSLGMTDMFSAQADFSAIGDYGGNPLFCSSVEQKVYIQLDRNGTKAAAVTWGTMKATSDRPETPETVVLDRPYIYAIVDNVTGIPMFLGISAKL